MKKYRFTKDLNIIDEVTSLLPAGSKQEQLSDHFEIIIALGNDATASLIFDSEDAVKWLLENDYIKEI